MALVDALELILFHMIQVAFDRFTQNPKFPHHSRVGVADRGASSYRQSEAACLLSDNGPCYIAGELSDYLAEHGMTHTGVAPTTYRHKARLNASIFEKPDFTGELLSAW